MRNKLLLTPLLSSSILLNLWCSPAALSSFLWFLLNTRAGKLAAGAKEDEVLQHAEALTIEEVVRRRSRRVRQLMKLYKAQYWGLLEEMRSKYRRFYLRHGKSGWRDDTESGEQQRGGGDDGEAAIYGREREGVSPSGTEGGGMREPHAPERTGSETLRCGAQGCLAKPLPLSIFCYEHILLEPRQRLYRPCSFVVRRYVPSFSLSVSLSSFLCCHLCLSLWSASKSGAVVSWHRSCLIGLDTPQVCAFIKHLAHILCIFFPAGLMTALIMSVVTGVVICAVARMGQSPVRSQSCVQCHLHCVASIINKHRNRLHVHCARLG